MRTATDMQPDTRPPASVTPSKRPRPRRFARRAGQVLAVLLILAAVGAALQTVAERRDAAAHPAPGEHVDLPDGRLLHLQVAGEHHDGPTVILEAGAGGSSVSWAWIQPVLAEHVTVVSYDRAGLGWSDPSGDGPDAAAVLRDLRDALAARGLPGPYVLVGHSLGSHYVRAFAAAHPDEIAGMVLVDPSHEDQAAATGTAMADQWPVFAALRIATRLGIMRLYNPFAAELTTLPEPHRDEALAQQLNTATTSAMASEMLALDRVGAQLPHGDALGDLPLRVLIATGGARSDSDQQVIDAMAELRRGLTALSTNSTTLVVPNASHVSIVTDPTHAAVVTQAVVDLLEALGQ